MIQQGTQGKEGERRKLDRYGFKGGRSLYNNKRKVARKI